jgi:hypothetical protein
MSVEKESKWQAAIAELESPTPSPEIKSRSFKVTSKKQEPESAVQPIIVRVEECGVQPEAVTFPAVQEPFDETQVQPPKPQKRSSKSTEPVGTEQRGSPNQPRSILKKRAEGETTSWLDGRWSELLLVACYTLAFTQAVANFEVIPILGIILAVFVFLASSFS